MAGCQQEQLKKCCLSKEEFDYTIRIVSEVLESNGSSSMGTVCSGILALMDGGVPIKAPVAGIAMGLVKDGDNVVILSDILGDEDHTGDMDFKVAGTKDGITALQMDIKILELSKEIMEKALEQARVGRLFILDRMLEALKEPREKISPHAPTIITINVIPDKIREVIGPGGKTIRLIQSETNTRVEIDDSGLVKIAASLKRGRRCSKRDDKRNYRRTRGWTNLRRDRCQDHGLWCFCTNHARYGRPCPYISAGQSSGGKSDRYCKRRR